MTGVMMGSMGGGASSPTGAIGWGLAVIVFGLIAPAFGLLVATRCDTVGEVFEGRAWR